MKLSAILLLLCVVAAPTAEAIEAVYRHDAEHYVIQWVEMPDETEIEAVRTKVAAIYSSTVEFLGERAKGKITIFLAGPAEQPDGTWQNAHVDAAGRIFLFRYTPGFRNYFGALAHEMVHAFRIDRRATADWFFEEGFAEYVALRTDPSRAGFPWFDFPVDLVAGQWLAAGESIPMTTLQANHALMNQTCVAQSYSLRSAFFDWLGREHGDDAMLKASKQRPAGALADYEKLFGAPLAELDQSWEAAQLEIYKSIPEVEEKTRSYRVDSPIQFQKVCIPGEDF